MKPSPPITIIISDFFKEVNLIFFSNFDFMDSEFIFIRDYKTFHLVVPYGLELALPRGKDFKSFVSTNFYEAELFS